MGSRMVPHALSETEIKDLARKELESIYVPSSVYRLQLNHRFTFRDAVRLIPYLSKLGVEALYVSPYFQSTPGCLHGYNVTDPNRINPEIGTREDFDEFCARLKEARIGQILDVVPNHMGIAGSGNWLWMDVLENGPNSLYAHFFDIDWEPEKKALKNKVLLPILGDHYGKVLENGEIQLTFDGTQFWVRYWDHQLPVAAKSYSLILAHRLRRLAAEFGADDDEFLEFQKTAAAFRDLPLLVVPDREALGEARDRREGARKHFQTLVGKSDRVRTFIESNVKDFNGQKGNPKSFDFLDQLLNRQFYRMAYWRVAADEINYRRFFNVNELAAIRIEDPDVFRHHHQLVLELLRTGKIQGLRVDHPDGLYDPPEYFKRLAREHLCARILERVSKRGAKRDQIEKQIRKVLNSEALDAAPSFFIVAEKILDRKESLPDDWAVCGTTGYDFLNALGGLFVFRRHEKQIDEMYREFTGAEVDFDELIYQRKKFFGLIHMASEISALGHRLNRISERNRRYRDFTLYNLTVAIRETIACFPVYRTYISPTDSNVSPRDEKYIHIAIEKAKRKTPALNPALYEYLKKILLLELEAKVGAEEKKQYRDFVLRFQQLTAPIMAKGLEDTALYRYNRLISLNEVGGDPTHFGFSRADFHRQNVDRNTRWPASFITSTTHDTKRSEDVRMRINVLSEIPEEWNNVINKWSLANEKHKTSIDGVLQPNRDTEYFIYQTLAGVWDVQGAKDGNLTDRVWEAVLKSVREANQFTNWISPDASYEEAVRKFIYRILQPQDDNNFMKIFPPFQKKISKLGLFGSLSSAVIKLGAPGVVDVYQGSEVEHYRLVDPDNRGAVDFTARERRLSALSDRIKKGTTAEQLVSELFKTKRGDLKLFLIWCGAQLRKAERDLFVGGDYVPLEVEGERRRNVVAFLRRRNGKLLAVVAGRFFSQLTSAEREFPLGPEVWGDTMVLFPKEVREPSLRDVFTQAEVRFRTENGISKIPVAEIFKSATVAMLRNGG